MPTKSSLYNTHIGNKTIYTCKKNKARAILESKVLRNTLCRFRFTHKSIEYVQWVQSLYFAGKWYRRQQPNILWSQCGECWRILRSTSESNITAAELSIVRIGSIGKTTTERWCIFPRKCRQNTRATARNHTNTWNTQYALIKHDSCNPNMCNKLFGQEW